MTSEAVSAGPRTALIPRIIPASIRIWHRCLRYAKTEKLPSPLVPHKRENGSADDGSPVSDCTRCRRPPSSVAAPRAAALCRFFKGMAARWVSLAPKSKARCLGGRAAGQRRAGKGFGGKSRKRGYKRRAGRFVPWPKKARHRVGQSGGLPWLPAGDVMLAGD